MPDPIGNVHPAWLTRRRPVCWTCAHLTAAGRQVVAGVEEIRFTCAPAPQRAGYARSCPAWIRQVGTDDEELPRRPRWPVIGTVQ